MARRSGRAANLHREIAARAHSGARESLACSLHLSPQDPSMRPIILPAALCLCAANLAAQTSLVLPAGYERAWGSPSNLALGANSSRTQIVFASPFPIGTVLLGIGLRDSTGTTDDPGFTADLEITVSSTAAQPGVLNALFAGNVGSDVATVLPRQIVAIAPMAANRSTGVFTPIPFTTPFVFGLNAMPNLLMDLRVFGRSAGAQWSTDRAL